MALRQLHSMAHDDEQMYDLAKGMPRDYEPPEYPMGLCFSIKQECLDRAGIGVGEPGATTRFSAMGEVTSIFKGLDECRIEICLTEFAGEDGQFIDLTCDPCICLCGPELEKMDLDDDCERGDTIHLIGQACLQSTSSSEFGGEMATLQITDLTFLENESEESREG